jgi:hypothetical protein
VTRQIIYLIARLCCWMSGGGKNTSRESAAAATEMSLSPHRVTVEELTHGTKWTPDKPRYSPQNLKKSEQDFMSFDGPQTRRRFFTLKEQQVRDWIEQVLQISLNVETPAQLEKALRSRGGRLLCELADELIPGGLHGEGELRIDVRSICLSCLPFFLPPLP